MHKEGLAAFKLKIYKLNAVQFNSMDALFLEQYHLLSQEHELNTLKVVNGAPQYGKCVYIYDLTCSILYYESPSQIILKKRLGIHTETSGKYTNTKIPYLGKFIFLNFLVPEAKASELSEVEFLDLLIKERQAFTDAGFRRTKALVLKKNDIFRQ